MATGKKIKDLLDRKNIKVASLAKETGIPATTLYSLINRDKDNVKVETLQKIAEALQVGYVITKEGKVEFYEFTDTPHGKTHNAEATNKWIEHKEKEKLDNNFKKANIEGKKKIIDYASDIVENPKYRKDPNEE